MDKPSVILHRKAKEMEALIPKYVASKEFKLVAEDSLINFIKRVKRGFMPGLGSITGFKDSYIKIRKRYSSNLGDMGKVNKSNATATGQMLEAMTSKTTSTGFILYVDDSFRTRELSGSDPRLLNSEVAKYYSEKRAIFDFSKPEILRIVRQIKSDLLKMVNKSK